jgi:endonuclease YncB( thermonuclease family)
MLALLVWLQYGRQPSEGHVLRVLDGDSFVMKTDGGDAEVRLFGIDSPERGQGWNRRSRAALTDLIEGETVRLEIEDIDRYDRIVARVQRARDGMDINAEQVRLGHSWVYRQYTDDPQLLRLEAAARRSRIGLWSLPEHERVPPWDWRRENRER